MRFKRSDCYSSKSGMFDLLKITLVATLWLVLAGAESKAIAQGPFIDFACKESCALTDAPCIAREQLCQTKLQLYRGYMGQLGLGVTLHRLPQLYVDLLQEHYNGNLANVRFGYADRQPAVATTDCTVIYFGGGATQSFVDKLRAGQLDNSDDFKLLLHELRHFNQCTNLGGRDQFAKRWFRDLDISVLQQSTIDFHQLHDLMPMESDAKNAANSILSEIKVLRDQSGKLVRPLGVDLLKGSSVLGSSLAVWVGTPHEFTARVSGGSGPFRIDWGVKAPNQTSFQPVLPTPGDLTKLEWTPGRTGIYELEAFVTQPGTELRPALKIIQVKVDANPLTSPASIADRESIASKVQLNKAIFRTLSVDVRRSLARVSSTANVCVVDRENQQVYGRKRVDGSIAIFTVPVGRAVDVTVSAIRFVGTTQTLTMPDTDRSITITINMGSGGPTCTVP